jgi:lipoate-protein ligase A
MESWRFLNTGFADGVTNMAIDEALLSGVERGESPPTVRVYAWDPPTVSTGHSQDLSRELDLASCARMGFGIVRRPTGGRAVLHAGELTYAVAAPSGGPPLGSTIQETYRAIAEALLAGLRALGVDADLERVGTEPSGRGGGASAPCFASSGRFEVVVGGRKLVGSAQRRAGRGVLQHGSLLIDGTHAEIADVMAVDEAARGRVRDLLKAKTTDLSSVLGRAVSFDEVAAAIRAGFERAWGVELRDEGLRDTEREAVETLATGYRFESYVPEKAVDSPETHV